MTENLQAASGAQLLYSAFGCSISSNRHLPGLLTRHSAGPETKNQRIKVEFVGPHPLLDHDPDHPPLLETGRANGRSLMRVHRLDDGKVRMKLDGVPGRPGDYFEFIIAADGSSIRVARPDVGIFEEALPFLYNAAFGAALRLSGITCLHANILEHEGRGLVLVGDKGAGKSTLSNALIESGFRLVADDITTLRRHAGHLWASPGLPQLRLTEHVAQTCCPDAGDMPVMWNDSPSDKNKRIRLLGESGFYNKAVQIDLVLCLGPRLEKHCAPSVSTLTKAPAMLWLSRYPFARYVETPDLRRQCHTDLLIMVKRSQLRAVQMPSTLSLLLHNIKKLLADSEALFQP